MKSFSLITTILFVFALALPIENNAQQSTIANPTEPEFGVKLSGLVIMNYILDTRQTFAPREGYFMILPLGEKYGPDGQDINATPHFNSLAIQSRVLANITGPDFFNAKTSGLIETEFFGHSDSDINGLRLRHAYVKLDWKKSSLMMGQFWHPMFVTESFPGVYSFNTGAPFQPFSRNPQLRFTTKGSIKFILAAITQRDFASRGPEGASSVYLRNAVLPNLHAQVQTTKGIITAGAGVDYKMLKPRIIDLKGNKATTTINGLSFIGYLKLSKGAYTWKTTAVYGQNLADHLMMSGIAETTVDPEHGKYGYSAMNLGTVWSEISGSRGKLEWGLFGGFAKNFGIDEPLVGTYYAMSGNVDHAYRIAPRVGVKSGKLRLGIETEYTAARYGSLTAGMKEIDTSNTKTVANFRAMLMALYSF